MTQMKQRYLKQRAELTSVKRDNLFINKEGETYKTPHDVMAALSILIILAGKPCYIQSMKIFLGQINTVTYYRCRIGAVTILD